MPMSDDRVRTWVETGSRGRLDFQTYFVKRQSRDQVRGVEFVGAETAKPSPGVVEEIRAAKAVIVAPSNPIISIGPILAVPGIRESLRNTKASVAAVSPIVAGRALKGPTTRMMEGLGMKATALSVAELYRDFLDFFVFDQQDTALSGPIEALGMKPVTTNTVMASAARKKELARVALRAIDS